MGGVLGKRGVAFGQERPVVLSLEPSFKRQIPSGSSHSCNVSHSAKAVHEYHGSSLAKVS